MCNLPSSGAKPDMASRTMAGGFPDTRPATNGLPAPGPLFSFPLIRWNAPCRQFRLAAVHPRGRGEHGAWATDVLPVTTAFSGTIPGPEFRENVEAGGCCDGIFQVRRPPTTTQTS